MLPSRETGLLWVFFFFFTPFSFQCVSNTFSRRSPEFIYPVLGSMAEE